MNADLADFLREIGASRGLRNLRGLGIKRSKRYKRKQAQSTSRTIKKKSKKIHEIRVHPRENEVEVASS
jgi:hypothetical protein